jgi:tetratricopeptide (TPR) repeat protein
MSRFVHLEFEGESSENRPPSRSTGGDSRCLAEAKAAFQAADFEQALRLYGRALEYDASVAAAAWVGQIRSLIELEDFTQAKQWADKALERFPKDADLLSATAVVLARLDDFEAAMTYSDAAFAERGEGPYLWLARADVFLSRREAMAEVCFHKVITGCERDWAVAWLAARIQMFYQQYAQALKSAQIAVDWNPGNAVVWATVAACQSRLGLVRLAESSVARALELDPRCDLARSIRREIGDTGFLRRTGGWLRQLFHQR